MTKEIIFPTIITIETIKYDFNYVAIRRIIQKYNFISNEKLKLIWKDYVKWWDININHIKEDIDLYEDGTVIR